MQMGPSFDKKSEIIKTLSQAQLNNLLKLFPGFTQFQVLFSSSFHSSFETDKFHELCDGKGASVTLITTTDGKTCGGYTSISWGLASGGVCFKKDSNAFLFSLDSPNKYKSAGKGEGEVCHFSI